MATSKREVMIRLIASRTNPATGKPYGRERAAAVVDRAVDNGRAERRRVAARKRRVLATVDREIAKRGGKPPRKAPARPSERTERARQKVRQKHADALRSWSELRDAIQREGGIRPTRDFAASEIPRELRAKRGVPALAPDEAAQILSARGFHYESDSELILDAQRRRERVRETHWEAERVKAHTGPSIVCVDACRNELGMFERCEIAARRAARYCRRRLRDAIGRFRAESRSRR